MEIKLVLFLPRDAASVPVTRQVLDGCLQTLGVLPETRDDIALALTEACANVIQHAGPGDEYEIMARTTGGRCIIEVVNTGPAPAGTAPASPVKASTAQAAAAPPAPPPALPPPTAEHGRGLKIMDTVVDQLLLTGNGREGTSVHMEKELRWIPGSAGELLFGQAASRAPGGC